MKTIKCLSPLLLVTAVICIMAGCKKESTCSGVPNVAVSISVNTSTTGYNALIVPTGYEVVTGGYDNIILYRYTNSQLNAFDCCCPYDGYTNSKGVVQIQSNKIYVACPVCGSTFSLYNGSVYKGPSTCSLKAYNTTYDGVSTFTVSN